VALADLYAAVTAGERRVNTLKAAVQTEFSRHFGAGGVTGDELENARMGVGSVKKQLGVLKTGQDRILPLLSNIATYAPPTIPFKIRELTLEGSAVRLEAETDSFEAIDRMKTALAKAPGFEDAAVSDSHLGSEPNRIVFRLTMGGAQP
jgi:hypothetical protein